jgi:hypothetical protein
MVDQKFNFAAKERLYRVGCWLIAPVSQQLKGQGGILKRQKRKFLRVSIAHRRRKEIAAPSLT